MTSNGREFQNTEKSLHVGFSLFFEQASTSSLALLFKNSIFGLWPIELKLRLSANNWPYLSNSKFKELN